MRASEGVELDIVKMKSSVLSLVSFWCTCEVPICIEDWISSVENHYLRTIIWWRFSFLVYGLYILFPEILIKFTLLKKEKMLTRKEIDYPYDSIWISVIPRDVYFSFTWLVARGGNHDT